MKKSPLALLVTLLAIAGCAKFAANASKTKAPNAAECSAKPGEPPCPPQEWLDEYQESKELRQEIVDFNKSPEAKAVHAKEQRLKGMEDELILAEHQMAGNKPDFTFGYDELAHRYKVVPIPQVQGLAIPPGTTPPPATAPAKK